MISPDEFISHLKTNILSFWTDRMVDGDQGGFYGQIDDELVIHKDANKGVILNTRILWTFSAAYLETSEPQYRSIADRAYQYISDHFFDQENGGVYWTLNCNCKPVNTKKQVYAQAFAIYALSEYHKIDSSSQALAQAKKLFELIERHSFDHEKNGYLEALKRDWTPIDDVRLSDKDMNATKTMNTHLHVLEAYTNLYRIWPDAELKDRLTNLVKLLSGPFHDGNGHFNLFFDTNWKLLSDDISFGHDIEGSWLLYEAAEVIGDEKLLEQTKNIALLMAEATLAGLDADGGLMYEANPEGLKDTDKHWWPQAEALVGFMNAWELSGDDNYLILVAKNWQFILKNMLHPDGEWHWRVSREGKVITGEDMAGPWKCPYHNGRAMIELSQRLRRKNPNWDFLEKSH
jgi:cellobiose epimerase